MMTNLAPPQIRAITGLELAAGVFTKCSDGLASQLNISLTAGRREPGPTEFRIGINGDIYGGMLAPLEVGTRRVDIAYVNPAAMVAIAYRGKGYYKQKMPLRVLGCFPSWDRIALVVYKDLGVKSLHDIARRKIPLHVSTRFSGVNNGPITRSRRFFLSTAYRSTKSKVGAARSRSAAGHFRRSG